MRRWYQPLGVAIVTAALTVAAVAVFPGSGGGGPAGDGTGAPAGSPPAEQALLLAAAARAAAAADQVTEDHYVAVEPCRIVDTRSAGGRVQAGQTRDFRARGTMGFEAQGGKPGGCGIPAAASSITVSVSSTNIAGTGYVRTWPFGGPPPTATIAHYIAGPISTTGGTITLGSGAFDFSLQAFDAGASPVVDVTGYFVPPIAATISSAGHILYGSSPRVLSASRVALGRYSVTLDRTVTNCVPTVTMMGIQAAGAMVLAGNVGDVYTYSLVNGVLTSADLGFSFTITC